MTGKGFIVLQGTSAVDGQTREGERLSWSPLLRHGDCELQDARQTQG